MLSTRIPASFNRAARIRPALRGAKLTFLVLLVMGLSRGSTESAESAHDTYVRAVQALGQYQENMNGRWFAVKALRTHFGSADSPDKQPNVRGTYGIVFYSESILYVNVQRLLSSNTSNQPVGQHRELLVSENWSLSIDHSDTRPTLKVVRIPAGSLPQRIWVHEVDIISKFESQVRRFVAHEFAQPRFDPDQTLIVTFDRQDYLRNVVDERAKNIPKLEIRFSKAATLRPTSVCSFEVDAIGRRIPLAKRHVQYGKNRNGRPILRRILTETGMIGEAQTVDDLIVSEIVRPDWCDTTPTLRVPSKALVEMTGLEKTEENKSNSSAEIAHLIRRLDESEFRSHLARQQATLELSNDLVGSSTSSRAELNEADTLSSSYISPVLVATGVILATLFWPIFWTRIRIRPAE